MTIFIVKSVCYFFVVIISLVCTFQVFSLTKDKFKQLNLSDLIISNTILLLGTYHAVSNLFALYAQQYKLTQILAYVLIFSITSSLLAVLTNLTYGFIDKKLKSSNSSINELTATLIIIGISFLVYFWFVTFLDIILPYPVLIYK